jgi:hypothetical protein
MSQRYDPSGQHPGPARTGAARAPAARASTRSRIAPPAETPARGASEIRQDHDDGGAQPTNSLPTGETLSRRPILGFSMNRAVVGCARISAEPLASTNSPPTRETQVRNLQLLDYELAESDGCAKK